MSYYPTETYRLPSAAWTQDNNLFGLDAYAYGPRETGTTLNSGEYFSGRWAFYFHATSHGVIGKINSTDELVTDAFTGTRLSWFDSFVTDNPKRYTNFALSFTNSGLPIIACQDNGDMYDSVNKPYIHVFQAENGALAQTGWEGASPGLFNTLQVNNFGDKGSGDFFRRYQTGQNVCFYQKDNSLYYRTQTGLLWSTGTLISSDITSGYDKKTRVEIQEFGLTNPYGPHSFVLINKKNHQSVKVVESVSMASFAWDDFKRYLTGAQPQSGFNNYLSSGYGALRVFNTYGKNDNYCRLADWYVYNTFNIVTGLYTGYDFTNSFFLSSGYSQLSGIFTGRCAIDAVYTYDTFSVYPTGTYSGYNGAIISGGLNSAFLSSGYGLYSGVSTGYSIWSGYLT